ncbi:hypothetical protein ABE073_04740 [Lederbergia citrisecunda]|uniref:hypothetical protein n=1 Tax=Lederbergia citrisecunda TaxID=2833583 RepID=UPI003D2C7F46
MIITKGMKKIKGYIEYSYRPHSHEIFADQISDDDLDCMFESDTFFTLKEMLEKLKPEILEKIKEQYNATEVWVSNISFIAESEDKETTSNIMFADTRVSGHVATKINNEDIENRLLLNLAKVKQIIDNTLEQYPISYR